MTKFKEFIDPETGEIVRAMTETDLSEYNLRNKKQDEAYRKRQGAKKGRNRDFTSSRMDNLHEVYNALTTAQCGYLMLLQCYADYDGGLLLNADITLMSKRDMMGVLGLAKKTQTFYDFLEAAIKANVILEHPDGGYAINQRYHFRGAFEDNRVVKIYSTKLKRIYREVKAADIGLLYRMIPYIHYETNALCANPSEKIPERIQWLNRKRLAEAIGVNPDTLGRRLPAMKFDGEYVVARVKKGNRSEKYIMNPWVFYRKSGEPDKTLRALFTDEEDKR